jgi:hypothetical protein
LHNHISDYGCKEKAALGKLVCAAFGVLVLHKTYTPVGTLIIPTILFRCKKGSGGCRKMKKNYIQIHKTGITKQTSVSIHNFGCRKRIKVTFGCTKSGITKPVLVLTRSSIKHYGCRKKIKDTSRCKKNFI